MYSMYVYALQAEAELAQQTPGRIASNSTAGSPVIIPRLPHNPTRVDRLYVESLREHSKVLYLYKINVYKITYNLKKKQLFEVLCIVKW